MRGAAIRAIGVLSALILLAGRVAGQAKGKPITTHLSAKWSNTPLLLEASEYMAEESLATFWGFVEAMVEVDPHTYTKSKCFITVVRKGSKEGKEKKKKKKASYILK